MSDQPEPLAAILAEMRNSAKDSYAEKTAKRLEDHEATGTRDALDIKDAIQCLRDDDKYLLDLADRIEAAVERDEDRRRDEVLSLQRTIVKMQDAIARQADAVNAAALRKALENARSKFVHIKKCADEGEVSRKKLTILCEFVSQEIAAALAAPARNCDRFATAEEAEREYCKKAFFAGFEDPVIRAAFRWAFAPAEGGAE